MTTVIDTPLGIRHFQLCQLKYRLQLEANGGRCKGQSALTQARSYFGCTGNRAKVQEQIQAMIDNMVAAKMYAGHGLYNCCKDLRPPEWGQFTDIAIGPCRTLTAIDDDSLSGDETMIEPLVPGQDDHLIDFWTVYGVFPEGDVLALTDCASKAAAKSIRELFQSKLQSMQASPVG